MTTPFRRSFFLFCVTILGGIPFFANAYSPFCRPGIRLLLCRSLDIVNLATGILAALALLVFFWGLVKYIAKADDEKAKEAGKNTMIWGVVGLFVMFSVFGIVRFLQRSFDINPDNNRAPTIPAIELTP